MAKKKREAPEINASSMADIAFLLLIFFLVTTTMDVDKGIVATLPPWVPEQEPPEDVEANARNVLEILVNANDQLLVEGEVMDIKDLKGITIKHITNNGVDPDFSLSPQKAIVSLKNDKGTSYGRYLSVYDRLRAAYNQVRNDFSMNTYGKAYDDLEKVDQKKVREVYPLKLSEAEPKDYSGGGQ